MDWFHWVTMMNNTVFLGYYNQYINCFPCSIDPPWLGNILLKITTINLPSISFNVRRRYIRSKYANLFIYFSNLNITQSLEYACAVMLIFFWGFGTRIGNGLRHPLQPASRYQCWPRLTKGGKAEFRKF